MFVQGAELSRAFYDEVVSPLLGDRPHGAALWGWGSDVLGYDTERSTDHGWGPRLLVFLEDEAAVGPVQRSVSARLPGEFRGWPVRFGWDGVDVTDHVTVTTLGCWLVQHLGLNAADGMSTLDWLLTPQQRLLGVVAGAVHADETGAIAAVRRSLSWYPDELWRWLLACQWRRVAQEEAFVARTAEVGDDTGSAVSAARLVRDCMRLALLIDRRYAPYQKWLGTAFARGRHADDLPRRLASVVAARDFTARESALAGAYTCLAQRHNEAGITERVDPSIRNYHTRPAHVLMAERFADACLATVADPWIRDLPLIGAVDQAVDSVDLLIAPRLWRRLASLYA